MPISIMAVFKKTSFCLLHEWCQVYTSLVFAILRGTCQCTCGMDGTPTDGRSAQFASAAIFPVGATQVSSKAFTSLALANGLSFPVATLGQEWKNGTRHDGTVAAQWSNLFASRLSSSLGHYWRNCHSLSGKKGMYTYTMYVMIDDLYIVYSLFF